MMRGNLNPFQPGVGLPAYACSLWPSYHPSQIEMCTPEFALPRDDPLSPEDRLSSEEALPREDPLSASPRKVLVNGKMINFFESLHPGDKNSILCQLECYKRIEKSGLGKDVLVSRLYGVVQSESSGSSKRAFHIIFDFYMTTL